MKQELTPMPTFSKRDIVKGIILLVLYIAIIPFLTALTAALIEKWTSYTLPEAAVTLIPYYAGFLLTILLFKNYLIENLRTFAAHFGRSLFSMFLAFLLIYVLANAVAIALSGWTGAVENPNDAAVEGLITKYDKPMIVFTVFLAPLVEETLFRGMIFGSIWRKNRFLGYFVSWLLFGAAHVLQYAIMLGDWSILILMAAYLPMSIGLAFCYRRSGTIWTSVFMHMINNGLVVWASMQPGV